MEELIRQAFLHVEVIGEHVNKGYYDLVGPSGDIILPQVWDTVIQPGWAITMHMWPMPEEPKLPKKPSPPPSDSKRPPVTISSVDFVIPRAPNQRKRRPQRN